MSGPRLSRHSRALTAAGAFLALAGCEAPEPPAAPAPLPVDAPAPPSPDQAFADRMADLDFYVAEAGRLAAEYASSAEVRALGVELTREHVAEAERLAAAREAARPPIEEAIAPGEDKLALLEGLFAGNPLQFDKAWIDQQLSAQQDAVNTLRRYLVTGESEALKAYAAAALPAAENRLAKVEDLRLSMLALQPPP